MTPPTLGETPKTQLSPTALLKNVARNSGALTVTGVVTKLATFIVLVLANRALSRDEFGEFALVLATAEIIRVVAAFGVDQVSLRAFARGADPQGQILTNSLSLKWLTSSAAIAFFAGAAWYLRFTSQMWLGFCFLALDYYLGASVLSLVTFHQAQVRADRAVPGVVAGAAASVVTATAAFLLRAPMPIFLASVPIGSGVALVALGLLTRRWVRPSRQLVSRASISRLARSAWPLAAAAIMVLLYFRISTLMLAKLVGIDAVASYTPAVKLSEAFLLVPAALAGTTLPLLSRTLHGGPSPEGIHVYRSAMLIAIATSLPFGIGCSLLGRFVLVLVFGPGYAGSALALGLLGWAAVLMALNQQTGNALIALNREHWFMWVTAVNLATNLTANLVLIPRLSFNGAAIATLLTESVSFVMLILLGAYFLRQPRRQPTGIVRQPEDQAPA